MWSRELYFFFLFFFAKGWWWFWQLLESYNVSRVTSSREFLLLESYNISRVTTPLEVHLPECYTKMQLHKSIKSQPIMVTWKFRLVKTYYVAATFLYLPLHWFILIVSNYIRGGNVATVKLQNFYHFHF